MKTLLAVVADVFPGTGDVHLGVYEGFRLVLIGTCRTPCALSTKDIGRVIEVGYTRIDANGKLVWPGFNSFRDDLHASVAKLGQDDDLVRAHGEVE